MIREGGSAASEAANFPTSGEPSLRAPVQGAVFRLRPGISPIRLTEIRRVRAAVMRSMRGLLRNSKTPVSHEGESGTLDENLSLLVIEQTQSAYI